MRSTRHHDTPEEVAARHAAEVRAAADKLGAIPEGERDDLLQRMRWAGISPQQRDPLPRCHLHQSCQKETKP